MTLAEWGKKYNMQVMQPSDYEHSRYIMDTYPREGAWELFHLTDYVVRSVSGGTVWLYKR